MIGAKIECNRGIYMAIKNRIKNYEKESKKTRVILVSIMILLLGALLQSCEKPNGYSVP